MLIKSLGVIDFIGGLILLFGAGTKLPVSMVSVLAGVFIIKSLIGLLRDFASWIDLTTGILFVFMMFFPISIFICLVPAILLIQKGIVSFL